MDKISKKNNLKTNKKIIALSVSLILLGVILSGCTDQPEVKDTDGDGYNDDVDAFPDNPNKWKDNDNDPVQNKIPSASCSANPTNGIAPLTVYFSGSGTDSDGVITSCYWDFNDGLPSIEQNPTHIFQSSGTYTVTFTVKDDNGATAKDTISITVLTSQEPPKDYYEELRSKYPSIDYESMRDVRSKLKKIDDGSEILIQVLNNYNGYENLAEKKKNFAEVLNEYPDISEKDFLISLTHTLWLEKNKIVWSLRDYNKSEINILFSLDGYSCGEKVARDSWKTFLVTIDVIFEYSNFLPENSEYTRYEAVKKIIQWEMKNFFHAYSNADRQEEWGWEVYDREERYDIERIFEERVVGCHTASGVLIAMLRSINIPAEEVHFNGHGVAFIPTLGKYVHGDFIADFAVVPSEKILMTKNVLEQWINKPGDYWSYESFIRQLEKYNIDLKRKADGAYLYLDIHITQLKRLTQDDANYLCDTLKEFNLVIYLDKNGNIVSASWIPLRIRLLY